MSLSAASSYHLALEGVEARNPLSTTVLVDWDALGDGKDQRGVHLTLKRKSLQHCWLVASYDEDEASGVLSLYPFGALHGADPVEVSANRLPAPVAAIGLGDISDFSKAVVPDKKAVAFPPVESGLRHAAVRCSSNRHAAARSRAASTATVAVSSDIWTGGDISSTDRSAASASSSQMTMATYATSDEAGSTGRMLEMSEGGATDLRADSDGVVVFGSVALRLTCRTRRAAKKLGGGPLGVFASFRRSSSSTESPSLRPSPQRADGSPVKDEPAAAEDVASAASSISVVFRSTLDRDAIHAFCSAAHAAAMEKAFTEDLDGGSRQDSAVSERVSGLLTAGRVVDTQGFVEQFTSTFDEDGNEIEPKQSGALGNAAASFRKLKPMSRVASKIADVHRGAVERAELQRYGTIGPPPDGGAIGLQFPDKSVKARKVRVPKGALTSRPCVVQDGAAGVGADDEVLCFSSIHVGPADTAQSFKGVADTALDVLSVPTTVRVDPSNPLGNRFFLEQVQPRNVTARGGHHIAAGKRRRLIFVAKSAEARARWMRWMAHAIGQPHLGAGPEGGDDQEADPASPTVEPLHRGAASFRYARWVATEDGGSSSSSSSSMAGDVCTEPPAKSEATVAATAVPLESLDDAAAPEGLPAAEGPAKATPVASKVTSPAESSVPSLPELESTRRPQPADGASVAVVLATTATTTTAEESGPSVQAHGDAPQRSAPVSSSAKSAGSVVTSEAEFSQPVRTASQPDAAATPAASSGECTPLSPIAASSSPHRSQCGFRPWWPPDAGITEEEAPPLVSSPAVEPLPPPSESARSFGLMVDLLGGSSGGAKRCGAFVLSASPDTAATEKISAASTTFQVGEAGPGVVAVVALGDIVSCTATDAAVPALQVTLRVRVRRDVAAALGAPLSRVSAEAMLRFEHASREGALAWHSLLRSANLL